MALQLARRSVYNKALHSCQSYVGLTSWVYAGIREMSAGLPHLVVHEEFAKQCRVPRYTAQMFQQLIRVFSES